MKVLHLTLRKKWFDMIASGEKKEEYREIKPYWQDHLDEDVNGRFHDVVQFRHGYAKDAAKITFTIKDIKTEEGNPAWGAEPGKKYFVIKLGERIS